MYKVLTHASEMITGKNIRIKDGRNIEESDLCSVSDGALVYSVKKLGGKEIPHKIEWVGKTSDLPKKYLKSPKKNLQGKNAIIPGLIDCHTHLVFAGDRSQEFSARCAGATYQEIAVSGGGIAATVKATRNATEEELERLAVARVRESFSFGVRTLEIKSGYGLSFESEVKILKVIQKLKKKFPEMTLVPTFLGAHDFPKDKKRETYIEEIITEMLPAIAQKKIAEACDVFIDEGFYTVEEGRKILKAAQALGLHAKVHADELTCTEATSLAVGLGALSADHLLKISDQGIRDLSSSDTVAVLLPGTAFYLKAEHAPARQLIEAGARVALATDFNPGTCMTLSLPAIMTIAALYLKMSRSEIFTSVTYNAARALGLHSRKGTLEPGLDADICVLPFQSFEEMYYRFAWTP